ncbi:coiled-coil and C2 domain-containing protein 1-like isoform X2 [Ornithodoros turicata]|uniref:coiled-coil and C2 domain-containing protein 1-like isoform X2 n=1 Tax=Ornithodoros turicata TaxID=34597 RepID=UPI00313A2BAF
MARRGAGAKPRRGNAQNPLIDLGMFDIPNLDAIGDDDDDDDCDDGDLEAELSALLGGRARAPKKKPAPKQPLDLNAIQKMAAAVQDDGHSTDDDDANLSDDPELMAELNNLTPSAHLMKSPEPPQPSAPLAPLRQESLGPPKAAGEPSAMNMLRDRLQNYKEAEAAARTIGDSSKARRYGRALKTLEGMMKDAQAGTPVNEDDVPPPVKVPKQPSASSARQDTPSEAAPSQTPQPNLDPMEGPSPIVPPRPVLRPAPPPPPPSSNSSQPSSHVPVVPPRPKPVPSSEELAASQSTEQLLTMRRNQYKNAAVLAKKQGDIQTALKYVKTAKEFDAVLHALANGQPVDLSKMPPPPSIAASSSSQRSSSTVPPRAPAAPGPAAEPAAPLPLSSTSTPTAVKDAQAPSDTTDRDDPELFNAPPPPTSVMEALQQRLKKYQSTANEAKEKGQGSKARRVDRIVKQYEDAIKLYKAGKHVDFEELPTPPGFGPIPVPNETAPPAKLPAAPQQTPGLAAAAAAAPPPAPRPSPKPSPKPATAQSPPVATQPKKPMRRALSMTMDKQLQFLKERQRLFREAALEAKRRGDLEQAKEYLRTMKGIDPMIQATECGLPINASSIPVPPQLQDDFVKVEESECVPRPEPNQCSDETDEEEFRTLERDLINQHQMCIDTKDHFFKLGDVASGTKFEKLAQEVHQDLLVVRNLWKRRDHLPKFHYEARVFSVVRSHPDLGGNELEVTVIRGVNLPAGGSKTRSHAVDDNSCWSGISRCKIWHPWTYCGCFLGKPDDLDSYVIVTFPFPSDEPQTSRTKTVKDTNNPEYDDTFKYEINRKSRGFARVIKRHPIKFEIWSKRGFLRSDAMIGQVMVKFEELESNCEIHDSFDVYDGKKPTGGKLEVRIRVREPFVSKKVEEIKQRWLVIGS